MAHARCRGSGRFGWQPTTFHALVWKKVGCFPPRPENAADAKAAEDRDGHASHDLPPPATGLPHFAADPNTGSTSLPVGRHHMHRCV